MTDYKQWVLLVHTIVGNHTAYYKDTNEVNTVELLLKSMIMLKSIQNQLKVIIDGLNILLLPWINEENRITNI